VTYTETLDRRTSSLSAFWNL